MGSREMSDTYRRTSQGAVGLAGKYVNCPEVYSRESAKLFNRNWLCVGRTSEADASGFLVCEIEGNHLFVCRGDDGQIRAFRNFCRHRGSRLVTSEHCEGLIERIRCPYHAWAYDRQGRLVAAPNMHEVEGFSKDDYGLLQVDCEIWHGFVWIRLTFPDSELEAEQRSLENFLEPLNRHAEAWSLSELQVGREIVYTVDANWKLIFQNYSECYHCPSVHPALNRLTPYKGSSNDLEEGPILGGPMKLAEDCATMSTHGVAVGKPLPNLSEEQRQIVAYYTLFPTLFISLHPDYVLLHRLKRLSVDATEVVCQFLFHPQTMGQPDFDPIPAVEFWDMTNQQDWHVCELAHQGMREPGYVPGPYSNLESVLAAFDRHYLSQMAQS